MHMCTPHSPYLHRCSPAHTTPFAPVSSALCICALQLGVLSTSELPICNSSLKGTSHLLSHYLIRGTGYALAGVVQSYCFAPCLMFARQRSLSRRLIWTGAGSPACRRVNHHVLMALICICGRALQPGRWTACGRRSTGRAQRAFTR